MRSRFQTKNSRIFVGIVAVVFLAYIIGLLTGDSTNEPSQETVTPRITPTATATHVPTSTPTPTAIPTPSPTPEPLFALTVGEFFAEREENPVRFDLKYEGRKILLSGVVCEIRDETLLLGDESDLTSANDGCIFLSDKARLRDLPVEQLAVPSIADPFVAVCEFGEYSGTIFMDECVIPDEATLAALATATPVPTASPITAVEFTPTTEPTSVSDDQTQAIRTPTSEQVMTSYVFCDRLVVGGPIIWGQAPQVVFSLDPRVTGQLEEGDYVQILTPTPTEDGLIRVQVYPHDYRQVGQTNDQVWISWDEVLWAEQNGLSNLALSCED